VLFISAKRPSKPWLVVGPENRQPSSGRGGCGNGWEGLLVPSSNNARRNVLEQPSAAEKPGCGKRDAGRGGNGMGSWASPAVYTALGGTQ
jgi:hypothetical protein